MGFVLDRMEIEDVGANPQRLAEAIHQQLGACSGPVPVHAIARTLDILEIREERLTNIEGALITQDERNCGSILVNLSSSPQRRRFTVGHELGHFLNPWHRPNAPDGFWCNQQDMIEASRTSNSPYRRQEAEANSFAIELLAPRSRVRPYLNEAVDLRHVLAMAEDLEISREAAARRYVSLHPEALAVLFTKDGSLRYAEPSGQFPALAIGRGEPVPVLRETRRRGSLSAPDEVSPDDWLRRSEGIHLTAQALHQQDGFAITLLRASSRDDEEEDHGIDDTFEHFTRPGMRPRT